MRSNIPAIAEFVFHYPDPGFVARAKAKSGGRKKKTIYRVPPGPNLGEGKSRWFCVACMKSFTHEGETAPAACPEGHPLEDLESEAQAS